ncbi:MAG TPA: universal stress protein [Candidatus Kryptobacter bacterium]|nr:universal stress protein [Candidatus Kryptobacter bacterium]
MLVPEAKDYLKNIGARLEGSGLIISTSISRSNPAKAISKTAKSVKSDLVILATHGKTGSKPFWEGSITPKVIRSANIPILLVPVRE